MNKKGISIIALALAVVVIGILAGITTMSVSQITQETNARNFASEVKQIEHLVKEYKIINNGNLDFTTYNLTYSTLDAEFKSQLASEVQLNGIITLYRIDFSKIDSTDTMYGKGENGTKDIYLVSNTTGNVYYLEGYKWNDKTHYTLTDELKALFTGTTVE